MNLKHAKRKIPACTTVKKSEKGGEEEKGVRASITVLCESASALGVLSPESWICMLILPATLGWR